MHSSSTDSIKKTQFSNEAYDSSDQLKILYDVRVREVHRLTEMIDSLKKEHEIAIKKLKQQVAIAQAEIERSNISQSQLETLLITKKQELEKLEKHIVDLEKTNNNLESCKNELASQLETNKLIINDLERKIVVLEKGNRNSFEAVQYESNIKALIEKHKFELMNANAEQERITRLNEELVKENAELKHRVNQISQASDDNLARKSEIISRLSKQVDDAQKQCESLMKSSAAEENIRLQMTLKIVNEEKSLLLSKLEALEKENTRQEEELKQYESLSKISTFGSLSDGKDFDVTDVSGTLGTELFRALNGQKAKRQEIKNLQGQVDEKNEKIKVLTESENILKLEVNKLKVSERKKIQGYGKFKISGFTKQKFFMLILNFRKKFTNTSKK